MSSNVYRVLIESYIFLNGLSTPPLLSAIFLKVLCTCNHYKCYLSPLASRWLLLFSIIEESFMYLWVPDKLSTILVHSRCLMCVSWTDQTHTLDLKHLELYLLLEARAQNSCKGLGPHSLGWSWQPWLALIAAAPASSGRLSRQLSGMSLGWSFGCSV